MAVIKNNPENDDALVQQLIAFLVAGNAHITFEDSIRNLPPNYRGKRVSGLPYSIWELVEHLRISQWDILEFSRNAAHKSPKWPEGYWIKQEVFIEDQIWDASLKQIQKDKDDFIDLLTASTGNLYQPFPHGNGQNLVREALLIADHNSYHTGQIVVIRRLLMDWE